MKVLKYIGLLLLLIVLACAGYVFYIKRDLTPSYQEELTLAGLDTQVEVYFTQYGIPHIYAVQDTDAYYTLGYIHAMERLWQMDLLRHVGSGTLSELFGTDMVDNDRFLRTVGLNTYASSSAQDYLTRNHPSRTLVAAYLKGVNEYIANNPKPLEHQILGLDIQPFETKNIFEILTYMSFSFSNGHITDPLMTQLNQKLDSTYFEDLKLYHYPGESTLRSYDSRFSDYSRQTISLLSSLGVPEFVGSNAWVLAPEKTTAGKVVLANDPHIAFAQPAVWYEAHVISPQKEYYGYYIPGSPFPLLMHSETHATGITMFENDDMDFYVEEIHPKDSTKYQHDGQWKHIKTRDEIIHIKGESPQPLIIRSTVHGPVVSDVLREDPLEKTISMYWVTSQLPNYMLEAIYGLTYAESLSDVELAASKIHGPGLNIMYGDSAGNIAWWAVGKLPKRQDELATKMFYEGSSGQDDIQDFYPFDKNPHAINPPWGYVHSANNQPDTIDGTIYAGYYLPDDRAERIEEILSGDHLISIDSIQSMLLDDQSVTFREIQEILLNAIEGLSDEKLLQSLKQWKGNFGTGDFRPLIFQKWIYETVEAAQKDEIGDDLWETYQKSHTYKITIEHLIKNPTSIWWDHVGTTNKETRAMIIRQAFDTTMHSLGAQWGDDWESWEWGKAHLLTHKHATGDVLSFLNVGPFPAPGGNEVINNMGYTYSKSKHQEVRFGPSTRRIVDFSDVRNQSWSILPTGQSGNYLSPYYDDQADLYIKGKFRKMEMNTQTIKDSKNKIILHPQK